MCGENIGGGCGVKHAEKTEQTMERKQKRYINGILPQNGKHGSLRCFADGLEVVDRKVIYTDKRYAEEAERRDVRGGSDESFVL